MFAKSFLAWALLNTALVSADSPHCKPQQLGKYAPLVSDPATEKYCAAFLHGKAPRHVQGANAIRSGKTDIECLESDLKSEKKGYQSAICSCIVPAATTTTKCTTTAKSTTKCTTTKSSSPAARTTCSETSASTRSHTTSSSSSRASTTARSTTTISSTTTSSTSTSSTSVSSTTTSSTSTSSTPTNTCPALSAFTPQPNPPACVSRQQFPDPRNPNCVFSQVCDTQILGTQTPCSPTTQNTEQSCLDYCASVSSGCTAYTWDPSTGVCMAFSDTSGYTSVQGLHGAYGGCSH